MKITKLFLSFLVLSMNFLDAGKNVTYRLFSPGNQTTTQHVSLKKLNQQAIKFFIIKTKENKNDSSSTVGTILQRVADEKNVTITVAELESSDLLYCAWIERESLDANDLSMVMKGFRDNNFKVGESLTAVR